MSRWRVDVRLGDRSYPIVVGRGAADELTGLLPDTARRCVVVTDPAIPFTVDPGIDSVVVHVDGSEENKKLATIETLTRRFAQTGLTRSDVIVAVGGGLVTDVAGFAAAVWHRGTPVVHVPTTLLGMVDAAIGGKTAVNLPEGKNLVGAFWQPRAVVCDLDALDTLPDREMRCGLGEVAKYHFVAKTDLSVLTFDERVAACARIKADIVVADERESGLREVLNYGHTLAHAIEAAGGHELAHGEAVAVGLLFAAELGLALHRIDEVRLAEHWRVVTDLYELAPRRHLELAASIPIERLVQFMRRDKKATTGLTFVLDGPVGLESVRGVDEAIVVNALEAFFGRTR